MRAGPRASSMDASSWAARAAGMGAMAAEGKVGLMMNVPRARLEAVLRVLPALQTPTISSLSDPDWVDVNTILAENQVRDLVPPLRQAGARGIVEYPINKIIE